MPIVFVIGLKGGVFTSIDSRHDEECPIPQHADIAIVDPVGVSYSAVSMRDIGKPPVRGKTSPYGFFVKMCYEEHKKKYPNENVQVTEISKKCSEKWRTMSDDEKRRFYELAQKDAERYQAEVAAYGGEDAMRKRKRAKKDPNAPKRALSAFFFFSQDRRPEVQQQHPEWKVGQVAQELGKMWKSVSVDEKELYERKAMADKERYAEQMRDYKSAITKIPGLEHLEDDGHGMHLVHVEEHELQQGQIV
uniref:High mobility group protein 1.2 n=1 Tax=Heterorhabditis bacteriophora TaxID=37862 RepID=A0A1I7X8U3_HETBA